jgi:hypothetical protein
MLKWYQRISWKLGHRHGMEGQTYHRPWWINEAFYALGYEYARHIETQRLEEAASPSPIDLNNETKNAP